MTGYVRWNIWNPIEKRYAIAYYKDGYFIFQSGYKIKKENAKFSYLPDKEEFFNSIKD